MPSANGWERPWSQWDGLERPLQPHGTAGSPLKFSTMGLSVFTPQACLRHHSQNAGLGRCAGGQPLATSTEKPWLGHGLLLCWCPAEVVSLICYNADVRMGKP